MICDFDILDSEFEIISQNERVSKRGRGWGDNRHLILIDCCSSVHKFLWRVFTRPLLPEGSSLQVEILSVCLSVCLFVRHHFNISNLGPSNHRRIMLDPTHYASLERR